MARNEHDEFYDNRDQAIRAAQASGDTKQALKLIAHTVAESGGDLDDTGRKLSAAADRHEERRR